jgi:hypothetical protein
MVSICSSKSLRLLTKEVPTGQNKRDQMAVQEHKWPWRTQMAVAEHRWPWRNIVFC